MAPDQTPAHQLVEPLDEWQALTVEDIIAELEAGTEFALALESSSPEARAAAGYAIAIANHEVSTGRADTRILAAAEARLKQIEEGDRSKYWG